MSPSSLQTQRRLLFLLPFPPRLDATHGGARATAQLISVLATRHRAALLYLRRVHEAPVDQHLQAQCDFVEEVVVPSGCAPLGQRRSFIASLLKGRPLWAAFTAVAHYGARLRSIVRSWQPDIVQIEFHVMGQYCYALEGFSTPRVLVEHEPGAKAARDRWRSSQGLGRMLRYPAMLAWKRFEQQVVGQVQAIVTFSETDRQAITEYTQWKPVIRIPLGTVVPKHPLNPIGVQPARVLFFGNFRHPPNLDAAVRLISEIFPCVQARDPGVTLQIVGDEPPPQLQRMTNGRVLVTGRVPDVTPYLDSAALVAVPLRMGGGMRVKVLESLAAGKAIIASPHAIEGLDLVANREVLLATTDQQFCDGISRLLADREMRAALARHARAWACANLGWDKIADSYEKLYESLIQNCRPEDEL